MDPVHLFLSSFYIFLYTAPMPGHFKEPFSLKILVLNFELVAHLFHVHYVSSQSFPPQYTDCHETL